MTNRTSCDVLGMRWLDFNCEPHTQVLNLKARWSIHFHFNPDREKKTRWTACHASVENEEKSHGVQV